MNDRSTTARRRFLQTAGGVLLLQPHRHPWPDGGLSGSLVSWEEMMASTEKWEASLKLKW